MTTDDHFRVFVTGGTGYLGRALIRRLVERGHEVTALVRPGSEGKLPRGARAVTGSAVEGGDWVREIARGATFVHLVGTPRPAPWKAAAFERVDLASVRIAAAAAACADAAHFVYLSVAQPAPVMKVYQRVREEGERAVAGTGMNATFVRPWYVLGPGHRWPAVLLPIYALAKRLPGTRESARRLGLVTLEQMTRTLLWVVENPAGGVRTLGVPEIRAGRAGARVA